MTKARSNAVAAAAKGDLTVGTGTNLSGILPVSATNGDTIVADSSQATGLKYQAPTVNTVVDAKGDLLAGTASDTIARIGIGANNTVLTADSAETTGMKWATPAAGGGMTLLSTTTMSGATTTVSSIPSGYKSLVIRLLDFYPSGSTAQMSLFVNGLDSTTEYYGSQFGAKNSTETRVTMSNNNGFNLTAGFSNYLRNVSSDNFAEITIYDYANTTTQKLFNWSILAQADSGGYMVALGSGRAVPLGTSAVTSISVNTNNGTWTAGSIQIYGVN